MSSRSDSLPPALVDAHVHLYAMYDRERFFRSAWMNFERARLRLGLDQADYVMCFTEDARHDAFAELASRAPGPIEIRSTLDEAALRVRVPPPHADSARAVPPHSDSSRLRSSDSDSHQDSHSDLHRDSSLSDPRRDLPRPESPQTSSPPISPRPSEMYVIAGRQIITSEGLELLALATRAAIPDGVSLADGVQRVRDAGGVPVVPWAFGKWWGRRGAAVREALQRDDAPDLGDNSARPAILSDPALFRYAESRGKLVLPGTDPLPLSEHETRAGSYGFVLEAGVSSDHPAMSLVSALVARSQSPRRFGGRVNPLEFVRHQLALRMRKKARAAGAAGR